MVNIKVLQIESTKRKNDIKNNANLQIIRDMFNDTVITQDELWFFVRYKNKNKYMK